MKASRLARLAALTLCCAGFVSETALAGGASSAWSDLWRRPDQQGQALLDAGEPARAASRFSDPRRRGYADLEAGHYSEAAKLLSSFKDPTSEYNLGNALARAGVLPGALAAYDEALKQSPHDRDIRHNRDLVERELRRQRETAGSSPGKGGQGGKGGRGKAGGKHRGSGSQHSGSRGSRGQMASNGPRKNGTGHSGGAGQQQSGQRGSTQSGGAQGSGSSKESPGQARRDAAFAAALARRQRQRGGTGNASQAQRSQRNGAAKPGAKGTGNPNGRNRVAGGGARPPRQPESEQELALDQWLRQIPDSPAGLLRRKFMIEYMLKHPNAEQGEPQ